MSSSFWPPWTVVELLELNLLAASIMLQEVFLGAWPRLCLQTFWHFFKYPTAWNLSLSRTSQMTSAFYTELQLGSGESKIVGKYMLWMGTRRAGAWLKTWDCLRQLKMEIYWMDGVRTRLWELFTPQCSVQAWSQFRLDLTGNSYHSWDRIELRLMDWNMERLKLEATIIVGLEMRKTWDNVGVKRKE